MKVDLAQAKQSERSAYDWEMDWKISGQIFYNGDNNFIMLPDNPIFGDIDIVMSDDFPIEEETGKPVFPLKRFAPDSTYGDPVRQYYEGMNIYFDGHPDIYFGNFNGNSFEPTSPTEAKDVLILSTWHKEYPDDYCPRFGVNSLDPDKESLYHSEYYEQDSNSYNYDGLDIYILPVGYVAEKEPRDVSDLLQQIQDESGLEYPQHDDKQKIINNDAPSLDER